MTRGCPKIILLGHLHVFSFYALLFLVQNDAKLESETQKVKNYIWEPSIGTEGLLSYPMYDNALQLFLKKISLNLSYMHLFVV